MPIHAAYVHVPFCVHRCGYCDFTVVAGRDDLIGPFLDALELELQTQLGEPAPVSTIFIGGGTPTYLAPHELRRLLAMLAAWLTLEPLGEFSVEANPAGLDPERMEVLREFGVNRISLGVQSFHQPTLQVLERDHTPDLVGLVCDNLRHHGFDNLALDLIYGVPGQSMANWEETVQLALELRPEHLSTYGLTFEKGTTYWGRLLRGELNRIDEELERSMYGHVMDILPRVGLDQYELSNFAVAGRECRHNQVYWRSEPYYGFGPGAAGFDGTTRRMNHRSVHTWLKRIRAGESPVTETEQLDRELAAREAVMLGLRQVRGIDLAEFRYRYHYDVRSLSAAAYDRFITSGWLQERSGLLQLTKEGRFVADTVMSEFLA
ncbi:MAG: radical SAM family heme chaperone HemW [Planctomycetaceae bacterium]|nr:radical SAM family heme chaperone HemW [Planctomycetaceae bacterium]